MLKISDPPHGSNISSTQTLTKYYSSLDPSRIIMNFEFYTVFFKECRRIIKIPLLKSGFEPQPSGMSASHSTTGLIFVITGVLSKVYHECCIEYR
jgi:hypothetical protein